MLGIKKSKKAIGTINSNNTAKNDFYDKNYLGSLQNATNAPLQLKKYITSKKSIKNLYNQTRIIQRKEKNASGLPEQLKMSIEEKSGLTMEDVKVHYNSQKPAQLQALAYTQGSEIFIGPGQEQHLGHEAWHVVQQKKGQVAPTRVVNGQMVNDDIKLEEEAEAFKG